MTFKERPESSQAKAATAVKALSRRRDGREVRAAEMPRTERGGGRGETRKNKTRIRQGLVTKTLGCSHSKMGASLSVLFLPCLSGSSSVPGLGPSAVHTAGS